MTNVFRKLGVAADAIRLAIHGPIYTATLDDRSASFLVTTPREYHHARRFTGEREILRTFLDTIESDDHVLDVGANVGVFSVFALAALDSGRVTAVEPHPPTAVRLRTNLAQNGPESSWTVRNHALGAEDTTAGFHLENDMSGFPSNHLASDGETTVTVRRAATLIDEDEITVPDVVKIDVEGAEGSVLDGFGEFLSEVRSAFVEVHPTAGVSTESIESRLQAAGLTITERTVAENENTPMLVAER
ncbi:FkbM family methyltransferase [Halococcoides cellulosivorans]|uniref:Methyltransferase FkbM domain-containing protein n=1 Tax=Halococcoides cellulosivorans TaxID=1679096 RepID=A0A2R4WXY6_9EURY|nr:FkbM family methyltransferase [Halococcoides cellulosivorans]AWB26403.1 hypothetical protein HARCEL1_01030 [Halococcoides cellulosivorans]